MLRSVIECGECFVRLSVDKKNPDVPLKLQVLEAEHLDGTREQVLPNGNVIKSGIEFNKSGRKVAYYLYKEHPGDFHHGFSLQDVVRVLASEILHIYKVLRPGQIRGEPWLSNVLLKLHELDQYEDAELVRKKTAAMFTGFVTRLDPENDMFNPKDGGNSGISGLEPGTMQFLDPGEDIKFSEPADVGRNYCWETVKIAKGEELEMGTIVAAGTDGFCKALTIMEEDSGTEGTAATLVLIQDVGATEEATDAIVVACDVILAKKYVVFPKGADAAKQKEIIKSLEGRGIVIRDNVA